MTGGTGRRRRAGVGGAAVLVGLTTVALQPPPQLSPVALLGTLALGVGLGVVAVAAIDVVIRRTAAHEDRSTDGANQPPRTDRITVDGGLADAEDFLRGGGGATIDDVRRTGSGSAESDESTRDEGDEDPFIWGEDRRRTEE